MKVGTKELKNRLSHYLHAARAGEAVYVTDRGKVVAEIRGVGAPASSEEAALRRLAAAGLVTAGTGRLEDFEPVRAAASASRLIIEDRG